MLSPKTLVILLVLQASVQGAAGSASLAALASPGVVAGVGLLSAMLSSGMAALVAATRWQRVDKTTPLGNGPQSVDDVVSSASPQTGR